ncbi:MAG: GNAT family N-acetyltransferase [Oscillospiraceae bacterium]|jgi:predicted acetyltransferase|nr:GNAT family N-acetyltransferase [Oscillospiraceae bacterium]
MLIRKIKRDEILESKKISTVAFEFACPDLPQNNETLVQSIESNPPSSADEHWQERYVAFDDAGKMISTMAVIPLTAYFDGHEVPINGIGDVATLPNYRRGGAIRQSFVLALADMYERGDVFSYLYPFSYYFYRKFGYETACETVWWRIPLAGIPKYGTSHTFEMYEPNSDISAFEEAYKLFAEPINLMLKRDEVLWKRRVTGFSPYNSNQWSFVCRDATGAPKGYFIYQAETLHSKKHMVLRDFAFADYNALCAMLELLASFASQYEFADIPLPPHISLTCLSPELHYEHLARKLSFIGMLRVVNIEKALRLAKFKGSGRAVIAVEDASLPQNTGVYAISFGGGETEVELTEEAPDLETDIQNFSRLLIGGLDLAATELIPKIKINGNIENLEKIFYRKKLWINDYF